MKFDFCWPLFATQKGGDSLCLSICKTNTALTIIIDKKTQAVEDLLWRVFFALYVTLSHRCLICF
jgi:hypothetical protein